MLFLLFSLIDVVLSGIELCGLNAARFKGSCRILGRFFVEPSCADLISISS